MNRYRLPRRGSARRSLRLAASSARSLAAALALVGVLHAASAAAQAPHLELDADRLTLSALPPVFADEQVGNHLTTGLTTTFAFKVELRSAGARLRGAARVDVRYELWDEVFHAVAVGLDGDVTRRTAASLEELTDWWSGLRLTVLRLESLRAGEGPAAADPARVELAVVPFSADERDDARQWLAESLARAERGRAHLGPAEEVGEAADEGPDVVDRAFQLLMASSIERRELTAYSWRVALAAAG